MEYTNELIESARQYWLNAQELNYDAGILSTLKEFFEDRQENPTSNELEKLAFQILTTS